MKTHIRDDIPAWVVLLGMGLVTLLLVRWMPAGIDVALLIIGSLMMLVAFIWARFWMSHLVPRARLFPALQRSRPRYFEARDGLGIDRPLNHEEGPHRE